MCLIVLSFQQHADFPVLIAANRDEFEARPAAPLAWWPGDKILAGRDLLAGGTWLGVNRQGQFAAVTNYREPGKDQKNKKSRGLLVSRFLEANTGAAEYAGMLGATQQEYDGYNLLFGDAGEVWYFSNRSGRPAETLPPGLYGLSNHLLDTPWFKVSRAKALFPALDPHDDKAVFGLLADRQPAPKGEVQQTGLPAAVEEGLSSVFITLAGYGTRASTCLRFARGGEITCSERGFAAGRFDGERSETFSREPFSSD